MAQNRLTENFPFPTQIRANISQLSQTKLDIHWTGVDRVLLHVLRRVCLAETPVFAVDQVLIEKNQTAIPDSVVRTRMANLCISCLDVDKLWDFCIHEECTFCMPQQEENKGKALAQGQSPEMDEIKVYCSKCSIQVHLDVFCPEENDRLIVTGKDVVVLVDGEGQTPPISVHPEMELFELRTNQHLIVSCLVTKACGRKHILWQPATIIIPRPFFSVTLHTTDKFEQSLQENVSLQQEFLESCPKRVFALGAGHPTSKKIQIVRPWACDKCEGCVDFLRKKTDGSAKAVITENTESGVVLALEVCRYRRRIS